MNEIIDDIKRLLRTIYKVVLRNPWQRLTRGFDDDSLFDLDIELAKFMIPRLKEVKKRVRHYPTSYSSLRGWKKDISAIIKGLELSLTEYANFTRKKSNQAKIDKAYELLGKKIGHLWL